MAFTERLRMQNIYGGGKNPFTPKETSPFNLLDQFKKRLPQDIFQPQIIPQESLEQQQQPLNTRMGYEIDPYKQALLQQREADRVAREEIARAQISSREKVAGERETTRKDLAVKAQEGRETLEEMRARHANELEENKQSGRESLADINARHAKELERVRGEETRKTGTQRTIDTIDINARRAEEQRKTNEAREKVRIKKGPTPSEQKVAEYLKARQLAATRPDLARFIQLGGVGVNEFTVKKPGGWRSPSEDQFKEINNIIYGSPIGPGSYSQTYTTEKVEEPNTPIGPTNEPNMSMVPTGPTGPNVIRMDTRPGLAQGQSGQSTIGPSQMPGGNDLNARAQKFLMDNGLPVTPANIQHAIQTGRVK